MSSEQNTIQNVTPECDACGKEESGHHRCGRCQSAYYCSQACQKLAWKRSHKQECATMQAKCNEVAQKVVETMQDESLPASSRVDFLLLEQLDGAGAYKAAVAVGLEDAIRQLFQEDYEQAMECYRGQSNSVVIPHTAFIVFTLFRGQRKSGIRGTSFTREHFGTVDGQRIQSYVCSHPDALKGWMDASFETMRIPFDHVVMQEPRLHMAGHEAARDVAAAWILVFVSTRASKAILLGPAMKAGVDAIDRAEAMANKLKEVFAVIWNAPDRLGPITSIEGLMNQLVAIIDARLREFGAEFDFVGAIHFEGVKKIVYETFEVPVGKKTTEKGSLLSSAEMQATMASIGSNPRFG